MTLQIAHIKFDKIYYPLCYMWIGNELSTMYMVLNSEDYKTDNNRLTLTNDRILTHIKNLDIITSSDKWVKQISRKTNREIICYIS